MMRRLLLCGIAAAALIATDAGAQPLQITPPAARPPASIPAKKPAVAKPAQKPVAAKPAQKPVVAKTAPGLGRAESGEAHPRPAAPLAPSAFAPEQTPAVPFTPPEKQLPQTSQQAALQPQNPPPGRATLRSGPSSAATISKPSRRPRAAPAKAMRSR